jgi:anthranilate synthase component I
MAHGSPFDIVADMDTPVSAYRKLHHLRPRFLLESVEGGERIGRYSFVGLGEGPSLRLDGDALIVDGVREPAPSDLDGLLAVLRQTLARAPRLHPIVPGLPFQGGLVGALGYDLVRHFERIRTPRPAMHPPGDGPAARAAVAHGEPEMALVAPTSVLVFDHVLRRAALLHAGSEADRLVLRRAVIAALRGPLPPPPPAGSVERVAPVFGRDAFLRGVTQAQEHIAAGDCFQLVLSLRMAAACTLDPFEVYRALRLLNPSPYLFFVDLGDHQIVGSSPEALVRLHGRTATLRPIAGTRPRGRDPEHDLEHAKSLLADAKELAEHVMLVDLARNDLGRVAVPGSIRVEPYRVIERYSHVMHTVSGVEGELLPGCDALDLLAAAFPAGTLVGAPKVRAMELIDEMEPAPRGLYGGTVGYIGVGPDGQPENLDHAITIRTLVFSEGACAWQAGAGIVADSVPEREYEECHAKAAALGAALAMAEEGL